MTSILYTDKGGLILIKEGGRSASKERLRHPASKERLLKQDAPPNDKSLGSELPHARGRVSTGVRAGYLE